MAPLYISDVPYCHMASHDMPVVDHHADNPVTVSNPAGSFWLEKWVLACWTPQGGLAALRLQISPASPGVRPTYAAAHQGVLGTNPDESGSTAAPARAAAAAATSAPPVRLRPRPRRAALRYRPARPQRGRPPAPGPPPGARRAARGGPPPGPHGAAPPRRRGAEGDRRGGAGRATVGRSGVRRGASAKGGGEWGGWHTAACEARLPGWVGVVGQEMRPRFSTEGNAPRWH